MNGDVAESIEAEESSPIVIVVDKLSGAIVMAFVFTLYE